MAEAITIACPECDKKINVPADAVGKKIRCKACEHVFAVPAPAGKKPAAPAKGAGAKKKAPDSKAAKPKPAKPQDDDEENSNPYGVTSLDTAPRCPECANEMESEEAIICLHCGYNTRTRSRVEAKAFEDITGMTWFWWLLPGILCVLAVLLLFAFDVWWTVKIGPYVVDTWYEFISYPWFVIWCIWAPSILVQVGCLAFGVKRLILNPRPPEREKKKKRREEDE